MNDEKLERVLKDVEPARRAALKKLVLGAAFSIPLIASFSVGDLHAAGLGSGNTTTTTSATITSFLTVTTTSATTVTVTVTSTPTP